MDGEMSEKKGLNKSHQTKKVDVGHLDKIGKRFTILSL